jgi:hypothetical protein
VRAPYDPGVFLAGFAGLSAWPPPPADTRPDAMLEATLAHTEAHAARFDVEPPPRTLVLGGPPLVD